MKTVLGSVALMFLLAATPLPPMGVAAEEPAALTAESRIPESLVGVVQSFNYDPRGECNGILLKLKGKLVQVNLLPSEPTKVAKAIAIGDKITVLALHEKTDADHSVYHARELITAQGQKIAMSGPSPGGSSQESPSRQRYEMPSFNPGVHDRMEPSDAGQQISLETLPMPKDDAEGRILKTLQEIPKKQAWLVNVSTSDARMLRLLAEAIDAKNVVEIGTSNGISAIWFGLALRKTGGRLITHEINPDAVALARRNFAIAGVGELITIVEGDAHQTVSRLKGPIDLAFIAADKRGYLDYLKKLLPLVRPGGLIVAHSVPSRVDPAFVKAITTNPDLETRFYLQGDGMSVTLKKR
jgi:predicted O-methyltransferase YrrM